jgi:hypothetical protein
VSLRKVSAIFLTCSETIREAEYWKIILNKVEINTMLKRIIKIGVFERFKNDPAFPKKNLNRVRSLTKLKSIVTIPLTIGINTLTPMPSNIAAVKESKAAKINKLGCIFKLRDTYFN